VIVNVNIPLTRSVLMALVGVMAWFVLSFLLFGVLH